MIFKRVLTNTEMGVNRRRAMRIIPGTIIPGSIIPTMQRAHLLQRCVRFFGLRTHLFALRARLISSIQLILSHKRCTSLRF